MKDVSQKAIGLLLKETEQCFGGRAIFERRGRENHTRDVTGQFYPSRKETVDSRSLVQDFVVGRDTDRSIL